MGEITLKYFKVICINIDKMRFLHFNIIKDIYIYIDGDICIHLYVKHKWSIIFS